MSDAIFCCGEATAIDTSNSSKPHQDPYRTVHDNLYKSFIEFAYQRQLEAALMELINKNPEEEENPLEDDIEVQAFSPALVCTPEDLKDNPLTRDTEYAFHLTTRKDFGLVESHRYFVRPEGQQHPWEEVCSPSFSFVRLPADEIPNLPSSGSLCTRVCLGP